MDVATLKQDLQEKLGPWFYVSIAALLSVALIVAFFGYRTLFVPPAPSTLGDIIPGAIEGFPVTRLISGDQAVVATGQSHVGRIGTPDDAAIAMYPKDLTVWVSEYRSEATATDIMERMAKAMKKFGKGFETLEMKEMGGAQVIVTYPGGKPDYYWARHKVVAYVSPGPLNEDQVKRTIIELDDLIDRLN